MGNVIGFDFLGNRMKREQSGLTTNSVTLEDLVKAILYLAYIKKDLSTPLTLLGSLMMSDLANEEVEVTERLAKLCEESDFQAVVDKVYDYLEKHNG